MSLTPKTIDGLAIPGKFGREELQRHHAAQPGVFRLIHHTHAAAAQLRKNSKMRDGLTDHNGEKNLLLAGHVRLTWLASQTNRLQILPFCRTIPKNLSGDLQPVSAKF